MQRYDADATCITLLHMPSRCTITITDEVMAEIEAQKPRSLSLSSFCALLIDKGLTNATATQTMGEPAARRASLNTSNKEVLTNKLVSMAIPERLEPYSELIREFWKIKKGSKGKTAWSRLTGQLAKLLDQYGDTVTRDQLELAINGKWSGIEVSRYEQFLPKKANTPAEPQNNHPASRVFTADDFDTPNPDNPLKNLF